MRDRFVGFAFAASELLLETDRLGVIRFATGAFKRWFAIAPEEAVGRSLASLLSGRDQLTAAMCLSVAGAKGRVTPVSVRLANAEATPMVLAGLCRPDGADAICFTLGQMPVQSDPREDLHSSGWLAEAIDQQLAPGTVGLIELRGLPASRAGADGPQQHKMNEAISTHLAKAAGPAARAEQLADGRYGLLAEGKLNVDTVVEKLQRYLIADPVTAAAQVRGTGIDLSAGDGLTRQQASSAMRYALGRFADGGVEATMRAGFADGLIGFMANANARAIATRTTIQKGQFKLLYQPIVALATGVLHHYEALLRPVPTEQNPGEGTQEFVSFAEAVGLAEELDLAVMTRALEVMRKAPWASVAINISGASVQSASFREQAVPKLRAAVQDHHLRPLIELTETAEISDVKEAAATVADMRAAGAMMCLDDFGAGAASYRYLRDFRVDFVKIDGSFIRRAATSARTHGMILSIVELANFVGAKVIAEMVETEEQAQLMRDAGIDFAQGWLYGKPGHLPGGAL